MERSPFPPDAWRLLDPPKTKIKSCSASVGSASLPLLFLHQRALRSLRLLPSRCHLLPSFPHQCHHSLTLLRVFAKIFLSHFSSFCFSLRMHAFISSSQYLKEASWSVESTFIIKEYFYEMEYEVWLMPCVMKQSSSIKIDIINCASMKRYYFIMLYKILCMYALFL